MNTALEISNALQPLLDAENKSMHLVIDAEADEKDFQLETEVYAIKEDTTDYLIMKQANMSFYVVDNLLLLENGNAFLLTEERQDTQESSAMYMDVFPLLMAAFDEFEIKRMDEKGYVYYQIEVTGEQMKQILNATLPSQTKIGDAVEVLQVQLSTKNGKLDEIQMKGISASNDTQISLAVTISQFVVLESGEVRVPQLIKDSARNVDRDKLFCLTKDLYRLIKAMEPLSDTDKLKGNMNWQVSCGPIQINTSIDMERLHALHQEESGVEGEQTSESETAAKLIELVGVIAMEGEISCTKQEEIYQYDFVLDEDSMKQLIEAIAPESLNYVIDFEKGSMKLEIKEEQLSKIKIGITGGFKALFVKVPVSVSVEFEFE